MPIISDPYNDQRNTLAQSIMRQATPGFLRQLNAGQARQAMDYQPGGTGTGARPQDLMQGLPWMQQQQANAQSGSSPGMTPPPAVPPQSMPSSQPIMQPGMSMLPPQPPQQMMPLSQPPQQQAAGQWDGSTGWNPQQSADWNRMHAGSTANADNFGTISPEVMQQNFGSAGGGTSAGSKGLGAQPPSPAAMKTGM